MKETIIIAGALAQKPGHGGHSWVFLQYLLGFQRLGWDVLFLDRLDSQMCVDSSGNSCELVESYNLRYFLEVMERYGLQDSFSLICDDHLHIGWSRSQVLERVRTCPFLINVMGYLDDPEILALASKKVFLDIDPGFGQMWRELGLADLFQGHDYHVTIALNMGRPECSIPTCGIDWIRTPQPVVLDNWFCGDATNGGPITSVVSWRGPFAPITYRKRTYGLRVHEFRKFASLPIASDWPLELALDIHPSEKEDLDLLEANGWRLVNPRETAGDPACYQCYIQSSSDEFMVAKNMYVQSRSGWFSDRSICYLASGKPVVAQDTGLADHFPIGCGLIAFNTLEDSLLALKELKENYPLHSSAARGLAEEYFDSDLVLGRFCAQLGEG